MAFSDSTANVEPIQLTIDASATDKKSSSPDKEKSEKRKKPQKRRLECNFCNKVCPSASNLAEHVRTHTGEKPFECKECPAKFHRRMYLDVHLRTHSGEKPYMCNICGRCFAQTSHLHTHMTFHSDEKTFRCTKCPKTFKYQQSLKVHLREHDEGATKFICSLCNKTFLCIRRFTSHFEAHNLKKVYKCDNCGKKFKQEDYVKRHQKLYCGNDGYKKRWKGRPRVKKNKKSLKQEPENSSSRPRGRPKGSLSKKKRKTKPPKQTESDTEFEKIIESQEQNKSDLATKTTSSQSVEAMNCILSKENSRATCSFDQNLNKSQNLDEASKTDNFGAVNYITPVEPKQCNSLQQNNFSSNCNAMVINNKVTTASKNIGTTGTIQNNEPLIYSQNIPSTSSHVSSKEVLPVNLQHNVQCQIGQQQQPNLKDSLRSQVMEEINPDPIIYNNNLKQQTFRPNDNNNVQMNHYNTMDAHMFDAETAQQFLQHFACQGLNHVDPAAVGYQNMEYFKDIFGMTNAYDQNLLVDSQNNAENLSLSQELSVENNLDNIPQNLTTIPHNLTNVNHNLHNMGVSLHSDVHGQTNMNVSQHIDATQLPVFSTALNYSVPNNFGARDFSKPHPIGASMLPEVNNLSAPQNLTSSANTLAAVPQNLTTIPAQPMQSNLATNKAPTIGRFQALPPQNMSSLSADFSAHNSAGGLPQNLSLQNHFPNNLSQNAVYGVPMVQDLSMPQATPSNMPGDVLQPQNLSQSHLSQPENLTVPQNLSADTRRTNYINQPQNLSLTDNLSNKDLSMPQNLTCGQLNVAQNLSYDHSHSSLGGNFTNLTQQRQMPNLVTVSRPHNNMVMNNPHQQMIPTQTMINNHFTHGAKPIHQTANWTTSESTNFTIATENISPFMAPLHHHQNMLPNTEVGQQSYENATVPENLSSSKMLQNQQAIHDLSCHSKMVPGAAETLQNAPENLSLESQPQNLSLELQQPQNLSHNKNPQDFASVESRNQQQQNFVVAQPQNLTWHKYGNPML